ncbi:NAD(P)-binding protein [Aspergillus steynii IBT 23096]|uniref:NAD(P)-binding protein n=1 Tax=Aspergillus steynii IBT 23096 TaxID=1392250 RepID=A0A2I2G379_9EURO|nr:NAD(P)-binding protein [Aspergillus steynii IBT 23096]PLB47331.1 NAD(P)-binding protein [Aspergillus steynii IBT 23096]
MPSYLITGASRGLGFEFLRQLSADPNNLVIGLVRNKPATEEKVAAEFPGRNVHLVQGELTDYEALKNAVSEVEKITPSLDHLIANAAHVSSWSAYDGIGDLAAKSPQELNNDILESIRVNVLGNISLFSLFLPLVQNGTAKKIVTITTGMADLELISAFDVVAAAPYSISKAAMNAAYAKFSAQYRKDGVLFMGVSPGLVDTGNYEATPEQLAGMQEMVKQFATYAPGFKGPITPEESVGFVLETIHRAEISKGYAGAFVSHYGNKQWL